MHMGQLCSLIFLEKTYTRNVLNHTEKIKKAFLFTIEQADNCGFYLRAFYLINKQQKEEKVFACYMKKNAGFYCINGRGNKICVR